MINLKAKWKLFAIGHFFANEMARGQAIDMFDRLAQCKSREQVEVVIDDYDDVMPWQEFRTLDLLDLSDAVEALALYAQEIENSTDEPPIEEKLA